MLHLKNVTWDVILILEVKILSYRWYQITIFKFTLLSVSQKKIFENYFIYFFMCTTHLQFCWHFIFILQLFSFLVFLLTIDNSFLSIGLTYLYMFLFRPSYSYASRINGTLQLVQARTGDAEHERKPICWRAQQRDYPGMWVRNCVKSKVHRS